MKTINGPVGQVRVGAGSGLLSHGMHLHLSCHMKAWPIAGRFTDSEPIFERFYAMQVRSTQNVSQHKCQD